MLIILEGPDCARKTTMADEIENVLSKRVNGQIIRYHRGVPTEHPFDEYVTPLLSYEPLGDSHIICDRWHWGEIVYPRIRKRATKMTRQLFMHIEEFLQSRGAITVLMNPSLEQLEQCIKDRADNPADLNDIMDVAHTFSNLPYVSATGVTFEPDDLTAENIITHAGVAEALAALRTAAI